MVGVGNVPEWERLLQERNAIMIEIMIYIEMSGLSKTAQNILLTSIRRVVDLTAQLEEEAR